MTEKSINEAVAKKLGWKQDYYPGSGRSPNIKFWFKPGHKTPDNLPRFCTDISAAWEITLSLKDGRFEIERFGDKWICSIRDHMETSDTAPMAICLAFLNMA